MGRTALSRKELQRVELLARVKSEELKLVHVAEMLGISYRQAKRLWRRYRRKGAASLKHGNTGRRSNRAKSRQFREKVLRLVRQKYSGSVDERFGPTLAAEHLLSEDGIEIDAETLRYLELSGRSREHFGELVQLDGSFHDWLEGRGPEGCLMNMVDDATGTVLCRLGAQETTWAAANILESWISKYGVPMALYTDWKNVYVREPTEKEELRGETPVTQFGRMCQKLGIRIIAANSPQAKGRVERGNGTHQDRLIKKMRRKEISSAEQANEFLESEYLPEHNRRFAKAPAEPEDFHRKALGKRQLREVFRLETERTIGSDWVVRYENRFLQVKRQSKYAPAKSKVTVCEWQDGTIEIYYREQKLKWEEISERPPAIREASSQPRPNRQSHAKPGAEHPWRRGYQGMKPRGSPAALTGPPLRVPACASP